MASLLTLELRSDTILGRERACSVIDWLSISMATEVPEVEATSQNTLADTGASDIPLESSSPSSDVELTNIKLKTKASAMQKELSSILTSVKDIKNRCAMLQVENRRLQEYIESFTMEK